MCDDRAFEDDITSKAKCEEKKAEGKCTEESIRGKEWMKARCYKTCGYCGRL